VNTTAQLGPRAAAYHAGVRAAALARALVAAAAAVGVVSGLVVLHTAPPPAAPAVAQRGVDSGVAAEQGRVGIGAAQATAQRVVAVEQLLRVWAQAVRGDDTAVLDSLMDPSADPAFVTAEASRAANLAGVPLSDWGYELGSDPAAVVPPTLTESLHADEVWAPPVVLRYAVAGADDTPTRKPVGLVLARRGDQWRLVSDAALTNYGRTTWRGPWDFGPVVARSTPQGVVLGHPGREQELDSVAQQLVTAVPAVTQFWGQAWPQRALVLLADSRPELESLVGKDFAGVGVAAVTTADAVNRAAGTATGVRVVFNPTVMDQLTAVTLRIVLRHELTHAAARSVTLDQAPLWMLEGFADYSGYRGSDISVTQGAPAVAALVRSAGPPDSLPTDADFSPTGPPNRAELAYQLSWTFAVFLAQNRGEDVLTKVYRAVAALPSPTTAQLDAAVGPVLGAPLDTLVGEWGQWLKQQVGAAPTAGR